MRLSDNNFRLVILINGAWRREFFSVLVVNQGHNVPFSLYLTGVIWTWDSSGLYKNENYGSNITGTFLVDRRAFHGDSVAYRELTIYLTTKTQHDATMNYMPPWFAHDLLALLAIQ